MNPTRKEKHFIVTKVEFDDDGAVIHCLIEAVITRRAEPVDWQELKDRSRWLQGWQ